MASVFSPATGPSRLRDSIEKQLQLSSQLFESLEKLSYLAERLPPAERQELLRELDRLKRLGKELLDNAQSSKSLVPYLSST